MARLRQVRSPQSFSSRLVPPCAVVFRHMTGTWVRFPCQGDPVPQPTEGTKGWIDYDADDEVEMIEAWRPGQLGNEAEQRTRCTRRPARSSGRRKTPRLMLRNLRLAPHGASALLEGPARACLCASGGFYAIYTRASRCGIAERNAASACARVCPVLRIDS